MERDLTSLYRELLDDPEEATVKYAPLDIPDDRARVAGPGELASDEPAPDACDHRWNFIRDWYGDPNVINGTADCSFWRCRKCGEEQTERPDDWDDGPDPDEWRERMED